MYGYISAMNLAASMNSRALQLALAVMEARGDNDPFFDFLRKVLCSNNAISKIRGWLNSARQFANLLSELYLLGAFTTRMARWFCLK